MNNALKGKQLRIFTGLALTPEVREFVSDVTVALQGEVRGVRWVPPENLHVTLKFLGNCEESQVARLVDAMQKAASQLPLTLTVRRVGAFPSLGSARVIWVGAEDLEGRVQKVYNVLEKGAERCGFPREKRPYRPHITIGRARKAPVKISTSVASGFDGEISLQVRDLVLFKSELKSGGAEYTVLDRVGSANPIEDI
jgi:2'-5' RNA ligase